MPPDDRKYAWTHEWIKLEGEGAVVGITDYAQEALGDITFVELPETGEVVEPGRECGLVESVKAASDLYAPAAGKISEVNHRLESEPELINRDPYGEGWIFRMEGVDPAEVQLLMDAPSYEAFLQEEEAR